MEQIKTAKSKSKGLSSNALKLIAIAAMTVDHITWAVFPGTQRVWYVIALHIIGRLTAPIMWFFIAKAAKKRTVLKNTRCVCSFSPPFRTLPTVSLSEYR